MLWGSPEDPEEREEVDEKGVPNEQDAAVRAIRPPAAELPFPQGFGRCGRDGRAARSRRSAPVGGQRGCEDEEEEVDEAEAEELHAEYAKLCDAAKQDAWARKELQSKIVLLESEIRLARDENQAMAVSVRETEASLPFALRCVLLGGNGAGTSAYVSEAGGEGGVRVGGEAEAVADRATSSKKQLETQEDHCPRQRALVSARRLLGRMVSSRDAAAVVPGKKPSEDAPPATQVCPTSCGAAGGPPRRPPRRTAPVPAVSLAAVEAAERAARRSTL